MKANNNSGSQSFATVMGIIILAIGIIALIGIGIYEILTPAKIPISPGAQNPAQQVTEVNISSIVAIGFLLIMLSITFIFPDMLKAGRSGNTSSMRVAVYMIICVFVFLAVKIGWNCVSFDTFKLDSTWAYVIAAALGSKALQSFSENKNNSILQPRAGLVNKGPNLGPETGNPVFLQDNSPISNQLPLTAPKAILKKL